MMTLDITSALAVRVFVQSAVAAGEPIACTAAALQGTPRLFSSAKKAMAV
jgi:hypothetical protein